MSRREWRPLKAPLSGSQTRTEGSHSRLPVPRIRSKRQCHSRISWSRSDEADEGSTDLPALPASPGSCESDFSVTRPSHDHTAGLFNMNVNILALPLKENNGSVLRTKKTGRSGSFPNRATRQNVSDHKLKVKFRNDWLKVINLEFFSLLELQTLSDNLVAFRLNKNDCFSVKSVNYNLQSVQGVLSGCQRPREHINRRVLQNPRHSKDQPHHTAIYA